MKFRVFTLCFCLATQFLYASSDETNSHKCDLLKRDCSIAGVSVSLRDKNLKAMRENTLLLKGEIIAPNIKIKGIQMDMGDMPVSVKALKNGEYEFKFIPAMCMMPTMSYEVFLYSGESLVGKVGEFGISH
ncbi:hypothetical protein [Campylobacter sp. 19-13652]|uniref:hypothetical protein n=1 Tax=Campylobacter sp. 19-13652 TaxID=2840180 RepID=UPI001C775E18|nr:hypothetical protein [Campylobacter sp. 19-13652]BCX79557.1 hypothetical protein LBC_10190 [Campylobacter sp. 19-13652]